MLPKEDKALALSKRTSIVPKVAKHNITKMNQKQLAKISAAHIPESLAIICVFNEVLVTKQSD